MQINASIGQRNQSFGLVNFLSFLSLGDSLALINSSVKDESSVFAMIKCWRMRQSRLVDEYSWSAVTTGSRIQLQCSVWSCQAVTNWFSYAFASYKFFSLAIKFSSLANNFFASYKIFFASYSSNPGGDTSGVEAFHKKVVDLRSRWASSLPYFSLF